jgi:hypothetical protein
VNEAVFDPYLDDENATPREGVHRTKKPRGQSWSERHSDRAAREEARARQVIIDVEGEIVEDD